MHLKRINNSSAILAPARRSKRRLIIASTAAAVALSLATTGVVIHSSQSAASAPQTRSWAASQSRWEAAGAAYEANHAAARGALQAAIDTAAGDIGAITFVSSDELASQIAESRGLFTAGESTPTWVLDAASKKLTEKTSTVTVEEVNEEMAAAEFVASGVSAQMHVSPAPVGNLRERGQKILNKLSGGRVKLAIAAGGVKLGSSPCHAVTVSGEPLVTITSCPAGFSERLLRDLLTHEWIHSITPPGSSLPTFLLVPGVLAREEIADCAAMSMGTDPAPGGYLKHCSPAQTAASLAVIGRSKSQSGPSTGGW